MAFVVSLLPHNAVLFPDHDRRTNAMSSGYEESCPNPAECGIYVCAIEWNLENSYCKTRSLFAPKRKKRAGARNEFRRAPESRNEFGRAHNRFKQTRNSQLVFPKLLWTPTKSKVDFAVVSLLTSQAWTRHKPWTRRDQHPRCWHCSRSGVGHF